MILGIDSVEALVKKILRKIPWATLIGLAILAWVLCRLPLRASLEALLAVRPSVVYGLLMGPLQVALAVAVLRSVLARVGALVPGWWDTLALNWEAGGVGRVFPVSYSGDVYRAHWLSRSQPLALVSQALLLEELLNLASSSFFQAAVALVALLWVPCAFMLESPWFGLLGAALAWQVVCGGGVTAVALSRLPRRLAAKLAGFFPGIKAETSGDSTPFPAQPFAWLVVLKFVDRVLAAMQIAIFLHALGLTPTAGQLLTLCAVSWSAACLTSFIPHQLGVEEAVWAQAFPLMGWPAATGLSLAFLRRADQILWAALGLLLSMRRGLGGANGAMPEPAKCNP